MFCTDIVCAASMGVPPAAFTCALGLSQVSFGNGRIEEFYVACNCLSAEQMAEPDVARALAAAMASFHFESLLHLPPQEATEPQASHRKPSKLSFLESQSNERLAGAGGGGNGQLPFRVAAAPVTDTHTHQGGDGTTGKPFCS